MNNDTILLCVICLAIGYPTSIRLLYSFRSEREPSLNFSARDYLFAPITLCQLILFSLGLFVFIFLTFIFGPFCLICCHNTETTPPSGDTEPTPHSGDTEPTQPTNDIEAGEPTNPVGTTVNTETMDNQNETEGMEISKTSQISETPGNI